MPYAQLWCSNCKRTTDHYKPGLGNSLYHCTVCQEVKQVD